LIDQIPSVSDTTTVYSIESLIRSLDDMRKHQPGFEKTGGMHAAGLFFGEPHDLLVREDIGRHNAVDKVIGALLESNTHPVPRALLLSGRCGWDIVSKAAKLDIPVIASIGAASTLAVKTARASNMTLVSFVKTDRAVVIGPVEGRIKRNH
jgi:FdhD protein